MNMIKTLVAFSFSIIFISNTATAQEQKLADKLLGGSLSLEIEITSCDANAKKFCSGLTINKNNSFLCLMAYEDSLTNECKKDIQKVASIIEQSAMAIEYAMNSCEGDARKHCFNVKPGESRILNCLNKNANMLSNKCSTALTKTGLLASEPKK
jgi:Cysteine rich repeat